MEQIGSIQLGIKTDKNFLNGIIPHEWVEVVYEHENFYACKCERNDSTSTENWLKHDKQFNDICKKIENEFKSNLMEIYSITSCGVNFIVY